MSEADTEQSHEVDQERTEANRLAHKVARLSVELRRAEEHYFDSPWGSDAEEACGETIDTVEQELYEATTAYEHFVSEEKPEVAE